MIHMKRQTLFSLKSCLILSNESLLGPQKIKNVNRPRSVDLFFFSQSLQNSLSGPSCSKYPKLNELISRQNVNCSSKYSI